MRVKFLFPTLAALLVVLTFFPLDAISDTESTSDNVELLTVLGTVLVAAAVVYFLMLLTKKERAFLKEHRDLLSSEDPKVIFELAEKCEAYLINRDSHSVASLLQQVKAKREDLFLKEHRDLLSSEDPKVLLEVSEKWNEFLKDQRPEKIETLLQQVEAKREDLFLKEHRDLLSSEDPKVLLEVSEKCNEYLKNRNSLDVELLAERAKTKGTRIQKEIDFQALVETFKSEISEDGSHPRVVATLKERMHNPDSFQHISSDYETVEKDGKHYYKIVMTFRGRNTFNALVLQTCYFLVDEDNQIVLVGSPDSTESSPANIVQPSESSPVYTAQLSESSPANAVSLTESIDVAASAVEDVETLVDLLSLFGSDE